MTYKSYATEERPYLPADFQALEACVLAERNELDMDGDDVILECRKVRHEIIKLLTQQANEPIPSMMLTTADDLEQALMHLGYAVQRLDAGPPYARAARIILEEMLDDLNFYAEMEGAPKRGEENEEDDEDVA